MEAIAVNQTPQIVLPNPYRVMGGFVDKYSKEIAPKLLIGKVPVDAIRDICKYFRESPVVASLDPGMDASHKRALGYLGRVLNNSFASKGMKEVEVARGLRKCLDRLMRRIESNLKGNEIYDSQRVN